MQAAVACMRGLRRLRLIRCHLQTAQMPGLPNILAKVPSLTVRIERLLHLYKVYQLALKCAAYSCSQHGDQPVAVAACAVAVVAAPLHDNLQVRLHACSVSDNVSCHTNSNMCDHGPGASPGRQHAGGAGTGRSGTACQRPSNAEPVWLHVRKREQPVQRLLHPAAQHAPQCWHQTLQLRSNTAAHEPEQRLRTIIEPVCRPEHICLLLCYCINLLSEGQSGLLIT